MDLRDLIKRHEGVRLRAYRDTAGVWTIGYGHTCGVAAGLTCTIDQAEAWLDDDLDQAAGDLRACLSEQAWNGLNPARRAALVDMIFNIGKVRFADFHLMLGAIEARNWAVAKDEMLSSKWASQVGRRAEEDAEMVSTGNWTT